MGSHLSRYGPKYCKISYIHLLAVATFSYNTITSSYCKCGAIIYWMEEQLDKGNLLCISVVLKLIKKKAHATNDGHRWTCNMDLGKSIYWVISLWRELNGARREVLIFLYSSRPQGAVLLGTLVLTCEGLYWFALNFSSQQKVEEMKEVTHSMKVPCKKVTTDIRKTSLMWFAPQRQACVVLHNRLLKCFTWDSTKST